MKANLFVFVIIMIVLSIEAKWRAKNSDVNEDDLPIADDLKENICEIRRVKPHCQSSKYRTIDGSCNNINHPLWGTAYSKFTRILKAEYGDGISTFQKSVTGHDLPNPRFISKTIYSEKSVLDPEYTIAMMQFGQVMAHDMSFGLESTSKSCCSNKNKYDKSVKKCDAIQISKDDLFFGPQDIQCMQFLRNVNDADLNCPASKIQGAVSQISTPTVFLDLSILYGSTPEQEKKLRSYEGGLMKTSLKDGHEFPPHYTKSNKDCFIDSSKDFCYVSSDDRINQNPHLTIIQVYYLREHNRISRELSHLNPHWDDEKLYQEARRINIAQYQYVSYYEWLTIFLGDQNMLNKKMIYHYSGDEYVNDYNATMQPQIFNEHANAAYRFFHTQIEGHLELLTESREIISKISLSDYYNKPRIIEEHFDNLGRGLVTQQSQLTDTNYDTEILDYLFKHEKSYGDDLRAMDIQRGRDHGVARYNDFREACGLPRAKKWEDYLDLIPKTEVEKLKQVYENFEDVELSVGGSLEKIVDDTTLSGPTLLCIFDIQFYNTRVTDRYWFESGDKGVAFTRQQLAEIRKSSFARLFCDNSNNVTRVQKKAFDVVDEQENPIVPCSEIPFVDLLKWKE